MTWTGSKMIWLRERERLGERERERERERGIKTERQADGFPLLIIKLLQLTKFLHIKSFLWVLSEENISFLLDISGLPVAS